MNMIGTAVAVYVLLIVAVFFMQRSLLYPAARQAPDIATAGVSGIHVVTTQTADGLELSHWYRPPVERGQAQVDESIIFRAHTEAKLRRRSGSRTRCPARSHAGFLRIPA